MKLGMQRDGKFLLALVIISAYPKYIIVHAERLQGNEGYQTTDGFHPFYSG